MKLQHLTSTAVADYLEHRSLLLVPIGSTEQHGWMGLVGTDALIAEAVANSVGERMGAIVAPTLSVGMAQHHMAFAGSLTLRPSTLIRVVEDVVAAAVRGGFRLIVFVNGHGGNVATVHTAFSEIYAGYSLQAPAAQAPMRLELRNFYEGASFMAKASELYGAAEGQHVTASEVAITQHLFPAAFAERIGKVETPALAPAVTNFHDAADYRRRFPDGRIGSNPSLARPAHGAELLECAVRDLVAGISALEAQRN